MVNNPYSQALFGQRQTRFASPTAARQDMLARQLLNEGINTSPADMWQGIARVGTAGIGGYLAGQAEDAERQYNADKTALLAKALSGDPNQAANVLLSDPKTADLGAQMAVGNINFNRERAAKKEDTADERQYQGGIRQENRQWQMADQATQQAFQKEMQAMNQAFAAGQQDKALSHAANLAQMQQKFTAGENALNRAAQTVPSGFRAEGGNLTPIPGGPSDPAYLAQKAEATTGAKMTDEQAKAAGFADRIANALPIIKQTTGAGTDIVQKGIANMPAIGNFYVSEDKQKFDQAQRDIINAILRRESGAVIAESEFDNARKQYFPQPGDTPAVLKQKEANLQEALQGMQRSAGPAYKPQQKQPQPGGIKFLGFE